ncbi:MAG: hypothetical protein GXO39_03920 [Thermotogae bacterium]|nr:hypothetical protein [Thermotogota bacterium]
MSEGKQTTINGDYVKILSKAAEEGLTACLIFLGREMGAVRICMIDGHIRQIDSTWGVGRKELYRVLEWKKGLCRIKSLTEREVEDLKEKNIVMTAGELIILLDRYGNSSN